MKTETEKLLVECRKVIHCHLRGPHKDLIERINNYIRREKGKTE